MQRDIANPPCAQRPFRGRATYMRHMPLLPHAVGSQEGNSMADDAHQVLINARAALTKKRLSWAQTIAGQADIPESAVKAIIDVQQAIEVIDIAIEELEEAELQELEEAEDEDD
jgi:hypothetical protein